jgi:hypothetical protein
VGEREKPHEGGAGYDKIVVAERRHGEDTLAEMHERLREEGREKRMKKKVKRGNEIKI